MNLIKKKKNVPDGYVRYCPACGHIGEVGLKYRDCCPDGSHAHYVTKEIAEQAFIGSTIAFDRDTPKKPIKGHPYLTEGDEFICQNCEGHIRTYGLEMKCCYHCGQRLDWCKE